MKTERRHELQTNQLADWMGHRFESLVPHTKTILAAVILATAVLIVAMVVMSDRRAANASAWTEFQVAYGSRDSEALADVAKMHEGSEIALWAKLAQADVRLSHGVAALYSNPDDATSALADARKAYLEVVNGSGSLPEMHQQALFGLAQTHEASSNLEGAKEYYQKVVDKFPDSGVGKESASRLEALKNPEVAKWIAWFSRQKPRPSTQPNSLPNLPGMPDDLSKLPDSPNLPPVPEGAPIGPATEVPSAGPPTAPVATPSAPGAAPQVPAPPGAAATPGSPPVTPAPPAVPPAAAVPGAAPPTVPPPAAAANPAAGAPAVPAAPAATPTPTPTVPAAPPSPAAPPAPTAPAPNAPAPAGTPK